MVLDDRRVKVPEIGNTTGISNDGVLFILHQESCLGYANLDAQ